MHTGGTKQALGGTNRGKRTNGERVGGEVGGGGDSVW